MSEEKKERRVPKLRFKGFTDDWMQYKLSDLYSFSNGINTAKENYGKGRKMISVMDILSEDYINYKNIISSVEVPDNIEETNRVEENDLVFVRSSETKEEVGWSKAYRDNDFALFSGFVIRGKNEVNFNSFFAELSLNYKNRRQIEAKANGSTRYNISQTTLSDIKILSPSTSEQNQICKLIETIDNLITLEQEKLKVILKMEQYFLQTIYSKNNKNMKEYKLEEFVSKKGKINKENKDYIVSSINNKEGFIEQNEQFENTRLNNLDKSTYKVVESKDFAYNPSRINVGSIGYNDSTNVLIVSPLYIIFSLNDNVINEYFKYYTKTDRFLYEVNRNTEGSVRQSLSFENLCNINFPLPKKKEEQLFIVNHFKNLENIINSVESKIEKYKSLKVYLLDNMLI